MQEVWMREGSAAERSDVGQLDELAAQASRGVRPAFEQIYLLLVNDLYAYARSHTDDDAGAEDVVATVFLKAWQYGRRYKKGSGSYRRWIFGIARNEVRNFWRAERKSQELERELVTYAAEIPEAARPEVDGAALRCALKSLTDDQRDVIVMRYFRGKTHREIADAMGKGEGSVRALQHRALRRMRKEVANPAM